MKGKKCPACGTVNKISNIVCTSCKEDLLRVPVTECDAASRGAQTAQGASGAQGGVATGFQRKCPDCGKLWPYSKTRCECGKSLFTVPVYSKSESETPSEDGERAASSKEAAGSKEAAAGRRATASPTDTGAAEKQKQPTSVGRYNFFLRSEDGKCEIPLPVGEEIIVGREGAGAEYLKDKAFVSSAHVKFTAYEEGIVIEHIGHTNPTQVNGIELEPNVPYQTQEGDLIVLGVRNKQGYHPSIAYFRLMSVHTGV
jgi:hypothetical protein